MVLIEIELDKMDHIEDIVIQAKIGEGNFGEVFKGKYLFPSLHLSVYATIRFIHLLIYLSIYLSIHLADYIASLLSSYYYYHYSY